jgi:hypothetical protein
MRMLQTSKWLAQKPRPFQTVAPWQVNRLGYSNLHAGCDLGLFASRVHREGRLIEW